VRLSFDGLIVDPCIPGDWKEFSVKRRWRGATYAITVKNPMGVEKGVVSVTLNGDAVDGVVRAQTGGTVNEVLVVMG
jgi:N,N'-diacetylchitobiose phosphorylase